MSKSVLYPFKINTDFAWGYAWTTELTRRLSGGLSVFSTFDLKNSQSDEPLANLYQALADAQGHYIKNFQLLRVGLRPLKSVRTFVPGEFESNFIEFIRRSNPDVIVLQSNLLSSELTKRLINSKRKVIVLDQLASLHSLDGGKHKAKWFIEVMENAAIYNVPHSFFQLISRDKGLFNVIADLFRK